MPNLFVTLMGLRKEGKRSISPRMKHSHSYYLKRRSWALGLLLLVGCSKDYMSVPFGANKKVKVGTGNVSTPPAAVAGIKVSYTNNNGFSFTDVTPDKTIAPNYLTVAGDVDVFIAEAWMDGDVALRIENTGTANLIYEGSGLTYSFPTDYTGGTDPGTPPFSLDTSNINLAPGDTHLVYIEKQRACTGVHVVNNNKDHEVLRLSIQSNADNDDDFSTDIILQCAS